MTESPVTVWGPFVLCFKCPFVYRCPVEEADALRYISNREGALIPEEERAKFHAAMVLAKKAAECCPVIKGWNPPSRPCLVLASDDNGFKCKQHGSDSCNWSLDAIVDCPYMRGDDVDVTEWEPDAR